MNDRRLADVELRSYLRRRAMNPDDHLLDRILTETEAMPQHTLRFASVAAPVVALAAAVLLGAILVFRPPSTPGPGQPPTPVEHACADRPAQYEGEIVHPIALTDSTGLVQSCRLITFDEPPFTGALTGADTVNPDGVETRLQVFWPTANCDLDAAIEVDGSVTDLAIVVPQRREGKCAGGAGLQAVELQLSTPIPAATVDATLITAHACTSRPDGAGVPPVTVVDTTNLVLGCHDVGSLVVSPPALNPDGVATRLEVRWPLAGCDTGPATVEITLARGRYLLRVLQQRESGPPACAGSGGRAIELTLAGPIRASATEVILDPVPVERD